MALEDLLVGGREPERVVHGGAGVRPDVGVEDLGAQAAGDLLEVELANGKKSLIPYKPGIADLEGGRIVLDPVFLA